VSKEIYIHFVTSVIAPLNNAVQSGGAERSEAFKTIRKIIVLAEDFEQSLATEAKEVDKALMASSASVQVVQLAAATDTSPLEKWLSTVRRLTPRQRSVAREIEILRTLEEVGNVVVLNQLHSRLNALGLTEPRSQAAIVTQISRLKKKGAVKSEAQGLYAHSDGGKDRLQKLRRNYGSLFVPEEVRDTLPHSSM
jgi:hypothetical protein